MDAGRPVIVEIWDGLYGPGFYALDLGYDAASRDELRWECFGDWRAEHPMDGVLVLDPQFAEPSFEHIDRHTWLMVGSEGSRSFIEGMIAAIGIWDGLVWNVEEYE
jgi:hypothetical protein